MSLLKKVKIKIIKKNEFIKKFKIKKWFKVRNTLKVIVTNYLKLRIKVDPRSLT